MVRVKDWLLALTTTQEYWLSFWAQKFCSGTSRICIVCLISPLLEGWSEFHPSLSNKRALEPASLMLFWNTFSCYVRAVNGILHSPCRGLVSIVSLPVPALLQQQLWYSYIYSHVSQDRLPCSWASLLRTSTLIKHPFILLDVSGLENLSVLLYTLTLTWKIQLV